MRKRERKRQTDKQRERNLQKSKQGRGLMGGKEWHRGLSGCLSEMDPLHLSCSTFLQHIPVIPQTKAGERTRKCPSVYLSTADLSDTPAKEAATHAATDYKHTHPTSHVKSARKCMNANLQAPICTHTQTFYLATDTLDACRASLYPPPPS